MWEKLNDNRPTLSQIIVCINRNIGSNFTYIQWDIYQNKFKLFNVTEALPQLRPVLCSAENAVMGC